MVHALILYLREHRWQRRLLTGLVAVIIGGGLGLLLYPHYQQRALRLRDEALISDLGSDNDETRLAAGRKIMTLAEKSEDTFGRVVGALTTDSDRQFVTVIAILKALSRQSADSRARLSGGALAQLHAALDTESELRFRAMVGLLQSLGKFNVPGRNGLHLDRLNAIYMAMARKGAGADQVHGRWMIFKEILTGGRDNRYVRQTLAQSCSDVGADVRELASILAARLGDSAALARLLADEVPAVASAAALSAAAGGRAEQVDALKRLLNSGGGDDVTAAAAYALATLDATASAPRICEILLDAKTSPLLRDRLLHVMTVLNNDPARKAVWSVLTAARRDQTYPPALALLAAGKLKMARAEPDIQAALTGRRAGGKLNFGHIQAAIRAGQLLELPLREEVFLLCRDIWGRCEPLTAVSAVRALGRQVAKDQMHDQSTRSQCIGLLRLAAATGQGHWPWPDRAEPITVEPLAGAAAAVALWLLEPGDWGELLLLEPQGRGRSWFIRQATHHKDEDKSLSGDYVAWHLAANGSADAMTSLGMAMLPPLRGGVHNDQERAAGAMLLALSARTARQKADAVARITLRLEYEDKTLIKGAYHCALLMLGRKDELQTVRTLRGIRNFPRRRAVTALLAVGDKDTVDWLLLDRHKDFGEVAALLTTAYIGEVLAVAAPALPAVDPAGDGAMQEWQVRIMRHHWGVGRETLAVGLRK